MSDGEKRIVSLAAFLADLLGREGNAPFIFDDPISSLDQDFEERTISRLVELSEERQVIIFTHRLSFLSILTEKAVQDELTTICINRESWGTGEPNDTPIHAKKPWAALNSLKNDALQKARKALRDEGSDSYNRHAQTICSEFRKLLERVVEMVLLAEVVKRYRRSIETKRIRILVKIQPKDCKLIEEIMSKYSCYEHSQSDEAPVKLPSPDELEGDIKSIVEWCEEFMKTEPKHK